MTARERVLGALATVRDPELDEPITDLGFVEDVEFAGAEVRVRLRLPTYFCAPNFAYMMVADARRALGSVEGVERVTVTLVDHHASEEINAGVARDLGFEETFSDEATGGLDDLRDLFRRKAFIARQERLARHLERDGAMLARLTVHDLPPGEETDLYLERRAELGIGTGRPTPSSSPRTGSRCPSSRSPTTSASHGLWV